MTDRLAEKVENIQLVLTEFRQETKENFRRVDDKLGEHSERLSALEAKIAGKSNGKTDFRWVYAVISALVSGVLVLAGAKANSGGIP